MDIQAVLDNIKRLKALVIGDIILDCYIWGDATRISPEAPVPVVEISEDTYAVGGAANPALNIKALGASAELRGWVGSDAPGKRVLKILQEAGVAFGTDMFLPGVPTVQKTRVFVRHQQLCRLDREAPPEAYASDAAPWLESVLEAVPNFDLVIFSDYAKGFLGNAVVQKVSKAAREAGTFIALDPKPKRPIDVRELDLITPNRLEALQLAGMELGRHERFPAEAVCRAIWEKWRPRHLVITMGEEGLLLSEEGNLTRIIPTVARQVFDVSGAGDTIIAALSLALAAGVSFVEAAHFANAAAGVVVGKVGTATASPAEILAYASQQ